LGSASHTGASDVLRISAKFIKPSISLDYSKFGWFLQKFRDNIL
jgi:hypothetical protein